MDFRHIEKRLFTCILLVSFLVALIVVLVNSLLSLSNMYFLRFGFLENQLALINLAIVLNLIAVTVMGIAACLKMCFQKRKDIFSLDTMPKVITNCLSEFIKGYRE